MASCRLSKNDKGWALAGLGNDTGAIKYLDEALVIDPIDKLALNNKGWALYGLGNYTEAIAYYDKALAIDPNYELALNNKKRNVLTYYCISGNTFFTYFERTIY
ncbi:MAG: tetratricopeptide repeat protein [Candidatus Nitrosopolaris sp.]